MNKKKKIFIMSLLGSIGYGIYAFIFHSSAPYYDGKSKLFKYLTLWDNGTEGIFFILVVLLGMFGIVLSRYRQYYYQFDQNCVLRIGLKKYLFKNIKEIFLESIIFMGILHIVLLMFDLIYFKDALLQEYNDYCYLMSNQVGNLILFIILSMLGMAILNIFVYSLSIFIHNIYVFTILPIIHIFVAMMSIDILVQSIGAFTDYFIARIVFSSFAPYILIQPCSLIDYPLVSYGISITFYIALSFLCFQYTIKKKNKEG